jgi:4-hydroxy-3-methylbut-2-enyl diphosphate reductase
MNVEIDSESGFCFGVVGAIRRAEEELGEGDALYCLGDIVHNSLEVERLRRLGLRTINHSALQTLLAGSRVLLRAHGEPPSTYREAHERGIRIIDATCPVVLRLQQRIKQCHIDNLGNGTQIVIYGKQGHAEVNGLVGQTEGQAIVVEKIADLNKLDFSRPVSLFSQTTMPPDGLKEIIDNIRSRMTGESDFRYTDTTCRQVARRMPHLKEFAARHDYVFFVAGEKSSNGAMLFEECRKANPNSFLITGAAQITKPLPGELRTRASVGVCGATSTPKWLMEAVADRIIELNGESSL